MHTQISGRITSIGANLVQGETNVTIHAKMDEVDEDTLDRLAEYCEMGLLGYARIACEKRPAITLPALVQSVIGNYANKVIKIGLRFHKRDVTAEMEAMLVEICRMGWKCDVEISTRQMALPGLVDKLTLEGNGKKVELS